MYSYSYLFCENPLKATLMDKSTLYHSSFIALCVFFSFKTTILCCLQKYQFARKTGQTDRHFNNHEFYSGTYPNRSHV